LEILYPKISVHVRGTGIKGTRYKYRYRYEVQVKVRVRGTGTGTGMRYVRGIGTRYRYMYRYKYEVQVRGTSIHTGTDFLCVTAGSKRFNACTVRLYPGTLNACTLGTRPILSFPVWSAGQISDSAGEISPAGPIFFG
jgi:hypothetical protein